MKSTIGKPTLRTVPYVRVILPLLWLLTACPQLQTPERSRNKRLLERFARCVVYELCEPCQPFCP